MLKDHFSFLKLQKRFAVSESTIPTIDVLIIGAQVQFRYCLTFSENSFVIPTVINIATLQLSRLKQYSLVSKAMKNLLDSKVKYRKCGLKLLMRVQSFNSVKGPSWDILLRGRHTTRFDRLQVGFFVSMILVLFCFLFILFFKAKRKPDFTQNSGKTGQSLPVSLFHSSGVRTVSTTPHSSHDVTLLQNFKTLP